MYLDIKPQTMPKVCGVTYIELPGCNENMTTPDWNDEDYEKCKKYDQLVKEGKMTWRSIKIC